MKKNISVVLLIAGIILAILAGIGTFAWLQNRTAAVVQAQTVVTEPVVVAASDLSWGSVLDTKQVKTISFLKNSLPQGYFSRPSEVAGRTLLYPVKAGAPLFESQLAPNSVKSGGMSALISQNKRAMAVKVDKVIGVSGFINPGSHVDVLVTIEGQSKTILENVLVLTVGPQMETPGKQEKPNTVDVITMEVTSAEAEKLALAASEGRVMLALRNPIDTDPVVTKGAKLSGLFSSLSAPVAKSAGVRKAATVSSVSRPVFVVQGIRGGEVSEYKFQKEGE